MVDQQQYHVVLLPQGWVRVGFGIWLTGKLGRAWVVHGVVHGVVMFITK